MREKFGKALRVLYASVEGISEAANTGSSILVSMTPSASNIATKNYIISYALGALNGIITWVTNYNFQGAEIDKRFQPKVDDEDQDESDYDPVEEISRRRQSAYLALKYSYITSAIVCDLFDTGLLYSAVKAWIGNLKDNEDQPLAEITKTEGGLILAYYILFDLPMILNVEIPETCHKIRSSLKIPENKMPDAVALEKLYKLVRPVARNPFSRKLIRTTGSIADTLEHVLPLVIIIPPSFILELAKGPTWIVALSGVTASLVVISVSGTILAQTYLFEGKFCEENLKKIAADHNDEVEDDAPWVSPGFSKVFHKLLYLGGPLHGVDLWLSILLTLREIGTPEAGAQTLSVMAFLIGWLGNHFSEVQESQESLKKITIEDAERLPLARALGTYGVFGRRNPHELEFHTDLPLLDQAYANAQRV